jgi:hypothetical protein
VKRHAVFFLLVSACVPGAGGPTADGGSVGVGRDAPGVTDAARGRADARIDASATDAPDAQVVDAEQMIGPDARTPDDAGMNDHIEGRTIIRDGSPLRIRAVGWNPVRLGGTHPRDLEYLARVDEDARLMQAIGVNMVRTYATIDDRRVLDRLWAHGIGVLMTVYAYGGEAASAVEPRVRSLADHPAIVMWLIGNEWNYNGLYVGLSHADALDRLNDVASRIRSVDGRHPIATVYGELPSEATIAAMPEVDVFGINAYRGISFGDLFRTWERRSTKPMFLAEYGADAYDARQPAEDQASQAQAVVALTREIEDAWVGRGGVASGGAIFEWCDEWWKDGGGRNDVHDVGGIAPGGGPFPDQTFNEEWWGLVEIDRRPREAYRALGTIW